MKIVLILICENRVGVREGVERRKAFSQGLSIAQLV